MFHHKYVPSVEAASVVSVLSFMAMCAASFVMSV